MKCTITIYLNNADLDNNPNELSDIVKELGHKLHSAERELCREIVDSNGNHAGSIVVEA